LVLSILIIPACTLAEWRGIKIIAKDRPPFSFKEGHSITGFSIELVEQLFNETGIQQEGKTEIWPWERALREIEKAPNILIPVMHRNKESNDLLHWVGPISPREIWLYKLTDRNDIKLCSLEDAKSYRVGVVRKSSSANFLINNNGFIENTNLQLTNLGIQNVKNFLRGVFA
jgi:polar amino acid transport system substrate-binding protein